MSNHNWPTTWLHRTTRGRVVYDRPMNRFRYRDSARILRAQVDGEGIRDAGRVFWVVYWAYQNMTARVQDHLVELAEAALAVVDPVPDLSDIIVDGIKIWIQFTRRARQILVRKEVTSTVPGLRALQGSVITAIPDNSIDLGLLRVYKILQEYLIEEGYLGKSKD
jgi:hypothetical protein